MHGLRPNVERTGGIPGAGGFGLKRGLDTGAGGEGAHLFVRPLQPSPAPFTPAGLRLQVELHPVLHEPDVPGDGQCTADPQIIFLRDDDAFNGLPSGRKKPSEILAVVMNATG